MLLPIVEDPEVAGKSFVNAFSAYIILIAVVFSIYLIEASEEVP